MVGNDRDAELRLGIGVSGSAGSSRVMGSSGSDQPQQITIFYSGRVCVCDVSETQARAIISLAMRMMDEGKKNQHQYEEKRKELTSPQTPRLSPHRFLNTGLSMKRSLQRFLQKRNTRINTCAPYDPRQP